MFLKQFESRVRQPFHFSSRLLTLTDGMFHYGYLELNRGGYGRPVVNIFYNRTHIFIRTICISVIIIKIIIIIYSLFVSG